MHIRELRNPDEILALRPAWAQLQHHPNSDLDHFLTVCTRMDGVLSPCVLVVEEGGQILAIAAGRLEQRRFAVRLGYLNLARIPARTLCIVQAGLLGRWDAVVSAAFHQAVSLLLRKRRFEAVTWDELPETSAVRETLRHCRLTLGARRPRWNPHWSMKLGRAPGFLLAGMKSKHRSWIKRKFRDLETAFPEGLRWEWLASAGDVSQLSESIETIARQTYQHGLNAGFCNNPLQRERLALHSRRGQLRVMILWLHNVPQAFWLGIVYQDTFHSEATGYVPALRDFEVGTLMFVQMTDELAREGVASIDFGLGDAFYKQRFGDSQWFEAGVTRFTPGMKGFFIWLALSTASALDGIARRLVAKFGQMDRIKRLWRRSKTAPPPEVATQQSVDAPKVVSVD